MHASLLSCIDDGLQPRARPTSMSVLDWCAIVSMQSQQRPEEESAKDKSSIWDWTPPGDLAETGAWKVLRELAMTLSKSVSCTLKLLFGPKIFCCLAMLHTQQTLLHQLQNCNLRCRDEMISCACSTLQMPNFVCELPYRRVSHMCTVQLECCRCEVAGYTPQF